MPIPLILTSCHDNQNAEDLKYMFFSEAIMLLLKLLLIVHDIVSSHEQSAHSRAYNISMLRRPSVVAIVVHNAPSSPKPLGQSNPNFVLSLYGQGGGGGGGGG